ncbi:MAG: hypothetical protein WC558_13435 [Patulibacter sp.]
MALFLTIVGLTFGPAAAQAGTWDIFPTITNQTGSDAPTCSGGASGGCMYLQSAGIVDGDWKSTPAGGNRWLPNGSSDNPNFDAPHLAEGADGYWAYSMPDGSLFSIAAEDDQGVTDLTNEAYAGCGVAPGKGPAPEGTTCLATYPPGTNGDPSSSDFKPQFTFYSYGGPTPPFTAAGQVCSTTTGSTRCGAGFQCAPVDTGRVGGVGCRDQAAAPGAGQWSPTDPNNPMWLNFVNLGDSPVMMANLNTIPLTEGWGSGPNYTLACTMQNKGDSCAFMTSGGCSMWKAPNCGSDAIQMIPQDGWTTGSVMVMQQASVTKGMAEDLAGEIDAVIQSVIWHALTSPTAPSAPSGETVKPRITKLRASIVPAVKKAKAAKAKSSTAPAVQVAYRNAARARSVLTFARETPGLRQGGRCVAATAKAKQRGGASCKRWTTLPGVATRTSTHELWTPKGGKACPKAAQRGPKKGSRCQQRSSLRGHQQNADVAGVNRVTVSKVGGKKLAAGRYRVSVRSLAGTVKSAQTATTFRIGKAS